MMYGSKHIHVSTVVCDDWSNACSLMKALRDISQEPSSVGEYAVCLTDEDNSYRIDFKFIPYHDDSVVFCAESELYEMIDDTVQDADQDTVQDIAYEQGDFEDETN